MGWLVSSRNICWKPIGLLTLTIQVKRVWRKGLKHKKGIPKADEQWVSNLIKRTTIKNGMSIFNVSCNLLKIPWPRLTYRFGHSTFHLSPWASAFPGEIAEAVPFPKQQSTIKWLNKHPRIHAPRSGHVEMQLEMLFLHLFSKECHSRGKNVEHVVFLS